MQPVAAVVMGVTSCGKTTVAEQLSQRFGARFIEGDSMYPASNIAKMSQGIALADDDRWPWLASIGQAMQGTGSVIAGCSALKRAYRDVLRRNAGKPLAFVFLDGSEELLAARIAARKGHFMPPSLLASQLATLERPMPDEEFIRLDIANTVDHIVEAAENYLRAVQGRNP